MKIFLTVYLYCAMNFTPSYIELFKSGQLSERIKHAKEMMRGCILCPHECRVDRYEGVKGKCGSRSLPVVSSFTPHYGEEPVISGTNGAGNIFFGNCNLSCIYCQNFEISQNRIKELQHEIRIEALAEIMIELQNRGCHNIGLVSPTHFTPQILEAIQIAAGRGLAIPIIYNSNGYDSVEILKLFENVVDIYLPDFKYGLNSAGKEYSKAPGYFDFAKLAIKEMYRQTGPRLVIEEGVVVKGLIIRHLVLPNDIADTEIVLKFIAEELSREVHVSLMCQYFPAHKADTEILLSRPISEREYARAIEKLNEYGLINGWLQEPASRENYRPKFNQNREDPFGAGL